MPTANDTYERIDRLLTTAERDIRRVFLASILSLRDSLDLDAIADLLATGDLELALESIMTTAEELGSRSTLHFINAAEGTAQFMNGAGVATLSFDRVNIRAVELMRANQLRLVREFGEGQRAAIREVMEQGIAQGIGPREQARLFRNTIGLTQRQTAAVINYERMLGEAGNPDLPQGQQLEALSRKLRDRRFDRTVRAAARRGRPLTKSQIAKMVQRYYERSVKHRAEVIARTEALSAVHQGAQEAIEQAIDAGHFAADHVEEKWVSAKDGRERDSHSHLHGQTKKPGELWQGHAGQLRYPGDPSAPAEERINCRCVVVRRIRKPEVGFLPITA